VTEPASSPLAGRADAAGAAEPPRVIVTRPAAQATPWVDALRASGLDAAALPLIDIGPVTDPAPVHEAWAQLASTALVFFVSGNAAQAFFALRPGEAPWPATTRAAAPGPATADALRAAGVPAALVVAPAADAPSYDSEQLWALLQRERWDGREVLVVRGEDGRDWLAAQWRSAGARVRYVAAYARRPPRPDAEGRRLIDQALADPAGHLWLFSSSEAVTNLLALAPGAPTTAHALATHPRIADAARRAGFATVAECAARIEAVVDAVRGQGARGRRRRPDEDRPHVSLLE
jgi:uroporphyrinogen-III synthase